MSDQLPPADEPAPDPMKHLADTLEMSRSERLERAALHESGEF